MSTKTYLIYATAINAKEAENIAQQMVQKRLVACVNIIQNVKSVYLWENKVKHEEEVVLIMKTSEDSLKRARKLFCNLSSYDCPAFAAMKINKGNKEFLRWIDESTSDKKVGF